jgi:hypothetical protein
MKSVSDAAVDAFNDLSLESDFTVLTDERHRDLIPVMDAECQEVAYCPTEKHAIVVAEALRHFEDAFWERIHGREEQNRREYEYVLAELATTKTPAGRFEAIANALNGGRISRPQALHLLEIPCSTSAKGTDE